MLTLRGPYCVVMEGSVTTRHRHNVAIDNPDRGHPKAKKNHLRQMIQKESPKAGDDDNDLRCTLA